MLFANSTVLLLIENILKIMTHRTSDDLSNEFNSQS